MRTASLASLICAGSVACGSPVEDQDAFGSGESNTGETDAESTDGAEEESGETGSTGSTDGGETDGETDEGTDDGPVLDVGPGDTGEPECPAECDAVSPDGGGEGLWLLHISNGKLWRVAVDSGESTVLCNFGGNETFTALTFTRDNRLMASSGVALYEIDPCECTSELRGNYSQGQSGIHGLAPDEANGLFGVSNVADALVRIDPDDAQTQFVGNLGTNFDKHGVTWSEATQKLLAINQPTNSLYEIDPANGWAAWKTELEVTFGPVGIEMHPEDGEVYACSGDLILYRVNQQNGDMTAMGGPVGEGIAGCTNLGAPWQEGGDVCLPPEG